MNKQEMIEAAIAAGFEESDAHRLIGNAPYMAEKYGMKPIETMEQFAGLLLYRVSLKMRTIRTSKNPAHVGMAMYDASDHLHKLYLLSCAGISPTKQRDLFPLK